MSVCLVVGRVLAPSLGDFTPEGSRPSSSGKGGFTESYDIYVVRDKCAPQGIFTRESSRQSATPGFR